LTGLFSFERDGRRTPDSQITVKCGIHNRVKHSSTISYRRGNDFSVGGAKIGEKQSRQSNWK